MKRFPLFFLVLFFFACADDPEPCFTEAAQICLSAEEQRLYEIIEEYRTGNDLPNIPLSFSLSKVAQIHAEDLNSNFSSYEETCNLHSWSDCDSWSQCCYTADHARATCMWDKPSELTNYEGNGFEIVAFGAEGPEEALQLWKASAGHNPLLINLEPWDTQDWKAIGIGVSGIFSVVWFGHITDPDGEISVCP